MSRRGTKTSNFGTSKREGHDSSFFYSSRMYTEIEPAPAYSSNAIENELPADLINTMIHGDSRDLSMIPDSSIHLVCTSPPYNSRKEYDQNLSLTEYLSLLKDVMSEVYQKLVDGGRLVVNIANLGRKPYIALSDHLSRIMTEEIQFIHRGEIIWDKGSSAGSSTAWGSWKSASNPCLRDVHEYILVFSKGTLKRQAKNKVSTISKEEFLEYTKSIWRFPTESAKKVGHPAPFPVELAYRAIQLYSFKGDVIFDPFMGSGTTALAALKLDRKFLGMDIEEKYVRLAKRRVNPYLRKD